MGIKMVFLNIFSENLVPNPPANLRLAFMIRFCVIGTWLLCSICTEISGNEIKEKNNVKILI